MKSGIEKTLIVGLFIYCSVFLIATQVEADTIYINNEVLSETYSIDTNSFYVYDTSVYQIPENEIQVLTEFIQRFPNIENHNDPYKPATQDYYLFNWITADNINIKVVERLHFYIEDNTRKISGIKYIEVK